MKKNISQEVQLSQRQAGVKYGIGTVHILLVGRVQQDQVGSVNNNDQGASLDVRYEVEHLIYTFSSLVSVVAHKILLLENQVLQCQLNLIHRWLTLAAPWGSFWDFPFWDFLNITRQKIEFLVKK